MPWLCTSKKKQPQSSEVIIADSHVTHSRDDSVISNGQPMYTVVLQNFEASVNDELSMQRGQVVEALYSDGEWLYVRNVDGKYGYVPSSFCYPLEQMKLAQWSNNSRVGSSNSPRVKPRPRSIHIDVPAQTRGSASSVGVNTLGQSHTPSSSQIRSSTPKPLLPTPSRDVSMASSVTPPTPRSTNRLSGMPCGRSPGNSPELARSSRSVHVPMRTDSNGVCGGDERYSEVPPCSRSMIVETTHSRVGGGGGRSLVRRSASMNDGTRAAPRVAPQRVATHQIAPLHRAYSYQEAMLAVEENMYDLVAEMRPSRREGGTGENGSHDRSHDITYRRHSSHEQSHDIMSRRHTSHDQSHDITSRRNSSHDQSHDTAVSRRAQFRRMKSCPSRVEADDVFLPEGKKPLGIYRSLQAYRPRFKGEIALRESELVILSDYGRGEWAWVISSNGTEGLIPKHLLVRYSPELGVGGAKKPTTVATNNRVSDATTQTELVVSSPIRQVSSASSASGGPSASSSNSSFQSHTNSPTSHRRQAQREGVGRGGGDGVMASSAMQTTTGSPAPWFENVDSLERPVKLKTNVPASQKKKRHTIAHLPSPVVTPLTPSALPSPGPLPGTPSLGLDSECDNVTLLHRGAGGGRPVLTATRDYSPPANGKNCLSLQRGDTLVSQPHMHYPRGWMWVWHHTQRTFGYVPKTCVAYTYNVPKTNRQRTDTLENAV